MKKFFEKVLYKIFPIERLKRDIELDVLNQLIEDGVQFKKDDTYLYSCSYSFSYKDKKGDSRTKLFGNVFIRAHSEYEATQWFEDNYVRKDPNFEGITFSDKRALMVIEKVTKEKIKNIED